MTQHTEGPWHVDDSITECGIYLICDGEEIIGNALFDKVPSVLSGKSTPKETAEARARKMAAAPELLAALQVLMPKNINIRNLNIDDETNVPLNVPLGELRQAQAAIDKALGTERPVNGDV